MAHYAFLTANNIVAEVIVGRDEGDGGVDWEQHYSDVRGMTCRRCSYNTRDGVHLAGGAPFRLNYPGPGWRYDPQIDAFLPPEPPLEE